jgi:hypothetical protein
MQTFWMLQDRPCKIEARSRNRCCRGKAISITYSECVSVALVIQHAKRMRSIILSSVACLALLYVSTLSHKRHDFRKKLLNIKCVFWFFLQLLSETFLILRRIQRDIIINVHRSLCKVPLLLSDFNESRIFSIYFRDILRYQISWKSVQWDPSCSMRTDMTELIVALRNFTNSPKNEWESRFY